MKLDREIFHKFFYAGDDESGRAKSNTSFHGWTFKSYNTTIGIKTPGKDGRPGITDSGYLFQPYHRRTHKRIAGHVSVSEQPYYSRAVHMGGCMVQARILHRRLVTSIHRPGFPIGKSTA